MSFAAPSSGSCTSGSGKAHTHLQLAGLLALSQPLGLHALASGSAMSRHGLPQGTLPGPQDAMRLHPCMPCSILSMGALHGTADDGAAQHAQCSTANDSAARAAQRARLACGDQVRPSQSSTATSQAASMVVDRMPPIAPATQWRAQARLITSRARVRTKARTRVRTKVRSTRAKTRVRRARAGTRARSNRNSPDSQRRGGMSSQRIQRGRSPVRRFVRKNSQASALHTHHYVRATASR